MAKVGHAWLVAWLLDVVTHAQGCGSAQGFDVWLVARRLGSAIHACEHGNKRGHGFGSGPLIVAVGTL